MFKLDYYASEYRNWRWQVPEIFNIATVCVHRWADDAERAQHSAIQWEDEDGSTDSVTYAQLSELTHRFAHALRALGVVAGDRVVLRSARTSLTLPVHPDTGVPRGAVALDV